MKNKLWQSKFEIIRINGEGTKSFLHGQTTSDFKSAKEGQVIRSCWLSTTGQLLSVLEVYIDEKGAEILVLGGKAQDLVEGFNKVIFPADEVYIESISTSLRAQIMDLDISWKDSNYTFLKVDQKYSEFIKNQEIGTAEEVKLWKSKQGILLDSKLYKKFNNPFEIGIGDFISLDKGCYLGQEAVSRFIRSDKLRQQLIYWEAESSKSIDDEKELSTGMPIINSEGTKSGEILTITKNGNSLTGLALIKTNHMKCMLALLLNESLTIDIHKPKGFFHKD